MGKEVLFLTEHGLTKSYKGLIFIPPDRLKSILSMYGTSGGLAVVAII